MPDLKERADEIRRICAVAGLSPDEMADRIAIKAESMRKIVNGYQPVSDPLIESMRNAARVELMRAGVPPSEADVRVMQTWGREVGNDDVPISVKFANEMVARLKTKEFEETVNGLEMIRRADPEGFHFLAKMIKHTRDVLVHRGEQVIVEDRDKPPVERYPKTKGKPESMQDAPLAGLNSGTASAGARASKKRAAKIAGVAPKSSR